MEHRPSRRSAGANAPELHAIQPSVLVYPGGRLQAVGRTRSGRVFQTWSEDSGKTWTPLSLTTLPNPSSGTDATTLRDGRQLIVYNHTPKGRTPLNIALSRDGTTWEAALVLESEPGEYSYPAVIQSADGKVHVTYTWHRQRVRHVVIDPARLTSVAMTDGAWPRGPGVDRVARPLSTAGALVAGTLTVGVLDILDAFIFFGLRGARPVGILQSIASGVLGRAAYQGGLRTAALGLLLHFVIAFGVVATYLLATRLIPALNRRPWLYGLLYGVVVYAVMNLVVVPLSAAALGSGPDAARRARQRRADPHVRRRPARRPRRRAGCGQAVNPPDSRSRSGLTDRCSFALRNACAAAIHSRLTNGPTIL